MTEPSIPLLLSADFLEHNQTHTHTPLAITRMVDRPLHLLLRPHAPLPLCGPDGRAAGGAECFGMGGNRAMLHLLHKTGCWFIHCMFFTSDILNWGTPTRSGHVWGNVTSVSLCGSVALKNKGLWLKTSDSFCLTRLAAVKSYDSVSSLRCDHVRTFLPWLWVLVALTCKHLQQYAL